LRTSKRSLVVLVLLAGCSSKPDASLPPVTPPPTADPDAGTSTVLPPRELPPELADLPRTDGGLPILFETTATMPPGWSLALAYDPKLDDPITRWGECAGRVVSCHQTASSSVAACIGAIATCADPNGGRDCCPASCLDEFRGLIGSGTPLAEAVNRVFVESACFPGLPSLEGEGP
jgi:hypothetical protein